MDHFESFSSGLQRRILRNRTPGFLTVRTAIISLISFGNFEKRDGLGWSLGAPTFVGSCRIADSAMAKVILGAIVGVSSPELQAMRYAAELRGMPSSFVASIWRNG